MAYQPLFTIFFLDEPFKWTQYLLCVHKNFADNHKSVECIITTSHVKCTVITSFFLHSHLMTKEMEFEQKKKMGFVYEKICHEDYTTHHIGWNVQNGLHKYLAQHSVNIRVNVYSATMTFSVCELLFILYAFIFTHRCIYRSYFNMNICNTDRKIDILLGVGNMQERKRTLICAI